MTEVTMGKTPIISSDATEIKRMVRTLEQIGQASYSVMVQLEQFKKWLKKELAVNPDVVKAMADNEHIQKFVNSAKEENNAV